MFGTLKFLSIIPKVVSGILFLMHGYSGNAESMMGVADFMSKSLPNTAIIVVQAPDKFEGGGGEGHYQWFSLKNVDWNKVARATNDLASSKTLEAQVDSDEYFKGLDKKDIDKSSKMLDKLINEQLKKYKLNDDRLIIAGFSQGGMMTMYNGLRRPKKPMGLVVFSSIIVESPKSLKSEIKTRPDVCLIHGNVDRVVLYPSMDITANVLRKLDVPVETHTIPNMPHTVDMQAIEKAIGFIKARCKEC